MKIANRKSQILHFTFYILHLSLVFLVSLGAVPAAKKDPQVQRISITTHLDKTALWVGDTLTYTIQAIHDRDVEFVLDNLKKENLSLAPFVMRAITFQQGKWTENKKLLQITLLLSSYEIGKTELMIPSLSLYYFVREPGLGKKEIPAQTVQVPATKVGLRSTLSGGHLKPRDFKAALPNDLKWAWISLLLGLAGLVFLAFRGVRWAWTTLQSARPTRRRLSSKSRDKFVQQGLSRIRMMGRESPEDLFQFYTELSQFLRQYLTQWLETDPASLTPEEIETALEKAGQNGFMAREIRTILEQCDTVRYAKDGLKIGRERQTELLEALERIVAPAKT